MSELEVEVRPVRQADIAMLRQRFPEGGPDKHREWFDRQQQTQVTYLVAWHKNQPVGHVVIKWQRPPDDLIASRLKEPCPHIEDLFVLAEMRSQGIGTQILRYAEELVRLRGYQQVGLSAGAEVDDPARRLYQRLGYCEAGWGEHTERYEYIDQEGRAQVWEGICIYLIKRVDK